MRQESDLSARSNTTRPTADFTARGLLMLAFLPFHLEPERLVAASKFPVLRLAFVGTSAHNWPLLDRNQIKAADEGRRTRKYR